MDTELSSDSSSNLDSLTHVAATDVGMRREENQDSYGILQSDDWNFYIVADGMGGVQGGAIASKLAIEVFEEKLKEAPEVDPEVISEAIKEANRKVYHRGSEDGVLAGMGTTFVGLGFTENALFIFNVGDSRVYRLRQGRMDQLTLDHTLVRELIASGAITEAQAENHPVSHMLTKSLGPSDEIVPDCKICTDGPARADRYLICSDGLYNMVSDSEIQEILEENSLEDARDQLITFSNERGGSDNITVVLVEIGDDYPVGPEAFPVPPTPTDPSKDSSAYEDTLELSTQELHEKRKSNGIVYDSAPDGPENDSDSPELQGGVSIEDIDREQLEQAIADKISDEEKVSPRRISPLIFMIVLLGGAAISVGLIVTDPSVVPSQLTHGAEEIEIAESRQPVAEKVEVETTSSVPSKVSVTDPSTTETVDSKQIAQTGEDQELPYTAVITPEFESELPQELSEPAAMIPIEETTPETFSSPAYEELLRRRDRLAQKVVELERQLDSFGQPISSEVGSILQDARAKRTALEEELRETRDAIDVATRRLAVWFGRRKRLQTTDPVNLAGEVAVSSEVVREQKTSFERATWEYLQEAESLRYNPTDMNLRQRVAELTDTRKQRMSELADSIGAAIKEEISKADQEITELSIKRDRIESDMKELQNQLEYVRILMHGDPESKQQLQQKIQAELAVSKSELIELEDLIDTMKPEDQ